MTSIPFHPARKPPLPTGAAIRELVALGRAHRNGQLSLQDYRDHVHVCLSHWRGDLTPGDFATQRSSGTRRRPAVGDA